MTVKLFILVLLVYIGLFGILKMLNYPKKQRHQQVWMLLAGLAFLIGLTVTANTQPGFLALWYQLAANILNKLKIHNDFLLVAVPNLLIVLTLVLMKIACLYIIRKIPLVELILQIIQYVVKSFSVSPEKAVGLSEENKPESLSRLVNPFYEQDSTGQVYLHDYWAQIARHFFTFSILTSVVLFAGLLSAFLFNLYLKPEIQVALPLFLAGAAAILAEIGWFLDGETRDVPEEKLVLRNLEIFGPVGDYSNLLHEYQQIWPNRYLRSELLTSSSQEQSRNVQNQAAGQAIERGENVLIAHPFYVDYQEMFFEALEKILANGFKTLILCEDIQTIEKVADWFGAGLYRHSGVKGLWSVIQWPKEFRLTGTLSKEEPDILVASPDIVARMDETLFQYLSKVKTCIVFNANRVVTKNAFYMHCFSRMLRLINPLKVQYLCLTAPGDGIENALRQLLQIDFEHVSNMDKTNNSRIAYMIWKAEGEWFQSNLLKGFTGRYIEPGIILALPAVKAGIAEIKLVQNEKNTIVDGVNQLNLSMPLIKKYIGSEKLETERGLWDTLEISTTDWNVEQNNHQFMIVYDTQFNLPRAVRLWRNRSLESGFLHVISGKYLLRDYFAANLEYFLHSPWEIDEMIPFLPQSAVGEIMSLLLTMNIQPVSEKMLLEQLTSINGVSTNVVSALQKILYELWGRDISVDNLIIEEENQCFNQYSGCPGETGYYTTERRYRMNHVHKVIPQELLRYTEVIDETGQARMIDNVLQCQTYQNFLPGQWINRNGKQYLVEAVDLSAEREIGVVHLKNVPNENNVYFRQHKHCRVNVSLQNQISFLDEQARLTQPVQFLELIEDMVIETEGYYQFYNELSLAEGQYYYIPLDEKTRKKSLRCYIQAPILACRINAIHSNADLNSRVAFTLAVLLNEVFPTLFPDSHQYIDCYISEKDRHNLTLDNISQRVIQLYPDLTGKQTVADGQHLWLYFISDSAVDTGVLDTIKTRLTTQIFPILEDYLDWLLESNRQPDSTINDGKSNSTITLASDFLSYDLGCIPACFDLENTLILLRTLCEHGKSIRKARSAYYGFDN